MRRQDRGCKVAMVHYILRPSLSILAARRESSMLLETIISVLLGIFQWY